jgi:hypothetical protein
MDIVRLVFFYRGPRGLPICGIFGVAAAHTYVESEIYFPNPPVSTSTHHQRRNGSGRDLHLTSFHTLTSWCQISLKCFEDVMPPAGVPEVTRVEQKKLVDRD